MMTHESQSSITGFLRSRNGLVLIAFLAIAAFYLLTEHTAHVLGVLPYLLFLLCPLLHLFMHGGHGGHDRHSEHDDHRNAHQYRSSKEDRR